MAALCANMDFLSPWGQGKIKFPSSFIVKQGFPGNSVGKESACNEGDLGSIPGLGKPPGGGHGNPLQVLLPGESPWTEEPGGLQSQGHKESTKHSTAEQRRALNTSPTGGAGRGHFYFQVRLLRTFLGSLPSFSPSLLEQVRIKGPGVRQPQEGLHGAEHPTFHPHHTVTKARNTSSGETLQEGQELRTEEWWERADSSEISGFAGLEKTTASRPQKKGKTETGSE